MLTIKQINMRGDEKVYPATAVYFEQADVQRTDPQPAKVRFDIPDGAEGSFDSGTIFVMNRHGATVSRWDLGPSPVPFHKEDDAVRTQVRPDLNCLSGSTNGAAGHS